MKTKIYNYFAAANSFDGFKSYFNEVLDPMNYSSIYILKGGPGTGKSSLMKKIMLTLSDLVDHVEAIHCSSDPNSLDGLILQKNNTKVAIIDGTAPHQIDPEFPACVDIIVNLGDFWNAAKITERKDDIKRFTTAKSKAYSIAYSYLKLAGSATCFVDEIIKRVYQSGKTTASSEAKIKCFGTRLISSYNKDGYTRINELNEDVEKTFSVVGIYGSEYIYMSELLRKFERKNTPVITYPCAFDDKKTEYIFDTETKTAYLTGNICKDGCENIIDTTKNLDTRMLSENSARLEFLWQMREACIWQAADELKKASENHFLLEKIYSSSMNFDLLNNFIEELILKIKETLD